MYNPKSHKAEEFINHEEVLDTLKYAQENKNNIELIDKILKKAKLGKGLTHREAAVLLDCEIDELELNVGQVDYTFTHKICKFRNSQTN